ncbi:hypothetical protein BCR44DRAFT_1512366 [Catenaria anguillulae PL171]|uniref:Uncharacterized protein n=1 Tax=Catenaria anguillulae PL171 TaxID=765915 RepID=A0A1Y2HRX3_9FUNG|nr:hypothetical protein BCR44DRAFT_1512366 [Catenaria anguillulae PL171]
MEDAQGPPPECATALLDRQDVGAFLSASQPQYHAYVKGRRLRPLVTHSRPSLANAAPASSIDSGLAGSLGSIERKFDQSPSLDTSSASQLAEENTRTSTATVAGSARRGPRASSSGPPRAFATRFSKSLLESHPVSKNTADSNMEAPTRPIVMRKGTPCASREMEPTTAAIIEEPNDPTPTVPPTTALHRPPTLGVTPSSIQAAPAEKVSQAFHTALNEAQTRENTMINTRRIPPNLDEINKSLGLGGSAPVDSTSDSVEDGEKEEDAPVDAEGKVHWRQRLASHRTISQATMTTTTSILEDEEYESDMCGGDGRGDAASKDQPKEPVATPLLLQVSEKPTVVVVPAVTVSEPLPAVQTSSVLNEPTPPVSPQIIKLIPDSLLLSPPQGPPEPIVTSLPPVADLVDIPLNKPSTLAASSSNIAAHAKLGDVHHQEMHIVTAADTTDLSYSSLSEFPTARAVLPVQPTPTVHTSNLDACPSVKVQRPPSSKLALTIHELMNQRKQASTKESQSLPAAAIDRRDSALARSNSSVKPGMRETVARILQSTLSRSSASSSTDVAASDVQGVDRGSGVNAPVDTVPVMDVGSSSPNASVRSIAPSHKSRTASNASSRTKRRWWARLFGGIGGEMGQGAAAMSGQERPDGQVN